MQKRGRKKKESNTGFERWGGYMNAKISKLHDQFQTEAGEKAKGIFNGITISVNGYTVPSAEELKSIMIKYGGTYNHYKSNTTTHVIASTLPRTKFNHKSTEYTVKPQWITDSVAAGRLLDYKNYLVCSQRDRSQPELSFGNVEDFSLNSNEQKFNNKEENEFTNLAKSSGLKDSGSRSLKRPIQEEMNLEQREYSPKNCLNTSNPNFLNDFYNNSRLHHISTTGAMFKQYVSELQHKEYEFVGRQYLQNWLTQHLDECYYSEFDLKELKGHRIIMHIDMDCFFVSVGLIKYPELKNKPVAVTHASRESQPKRDNESFKKELQLIQNKPQFGSKTPGNGELSLSDKSSKVSSRMTSISNDEKFSMAEIASCSYEARKKGVKNGMFLGAALKLCPDLATIPYDFEGYKSVSLDLYDIVASYTKKIEAVSCDEMFVDLTDLAEECSVFPLQVVSCMRQQIQEKTKCPVSAGVGPNMIVARMATKKAKPNGQFLVRPSEVLKFMDSQDVGDLPGVGHSMRQRLEALAIKSCGDLQQHRLHTLQTNFGTKTGKALFDSCRGVDRTVNKEQQRKSVSAEVNYGIRFKDWSDAEAFLTDLASEVSRRLDEVNMEGKTITLKLKIRAEGAPVEASKFMGHGVCDNLAKSITLAKCTWEKSRIYKECLNMMKQMTKEPKDMRGIGIQVSRLEPIVKSSGSSIDNYFTKNKSKVNKTIENSGIDVKKSVSKVHFEKSNDESSNECPLVNVNSPPQTVHEKDTSKVLDVSVLLALPEDLRLQVIEEYKNQGFEIPSGFDPRSETECLSPQPGPSRLSTFVPDEPLFEDGVTKCEDDDQEEQLENWSFSQIDSSFLNALPADVCLELRKDLGAKKSKEVHRSPNKNQVQSGPSRSPKRGRPRGRARGRRRAEVSPIKRNPFLEYPESTDNSEVESVNQDLDEPNEENIPSVNVPNLCGEVEKTAIKDLISAWIETSSDPDAFDIDLIADFCKSYVAFKDLEDLELILRFIYRKTRSRSEEWQKGFDSIMTEVQKEMNYVYNAPLYLGLS